MNTAARVSFGRMNIRCHFLWRLSELEKLGMKSDMALDLLREKKKRVIRHLVVPAWDKQPPPHSVPLFSRSQPHFLKQRLLTPKKSSAIGWFHSQAVFRNLLLWALTEFSASQVFFQELRSTEPEQTHTHAPSYTHTQSHSVRMLAHAHAHYLATH